MTQFYQIDYTRMSFRELWWGNKSPLVIIALILKWLRVRIPYSSDDPNVDLTTPFVVESLPAEVESRFQPLIAELAALGFTEPIYHLINDGGSRTTIYWATFRHLSGKSFARIHSRTWQQAARANRGLFPIFFTPFADNTFLVTSAGKPDMATPPSIQIEHRRGASTSKLWAAHQQRLETFGARKTIIQIATREDLLSISERYHFLIRDFHLSRGVFRQRTSSEQSQVQAFSAAVEQAKAGGHEYPEVLAELERLQEKKAGWSNALWVLAGSFVVFLAAGAAKWDWKFTLWIIPILLFHEAGHWIAMRLCNYRNLRMFFIPFFGAAVTGQHWNVPGWKKALVSLAGPVPGIVVGVVAGIAALILQQPWLNYAALLLLFVNGFNLLPVLPLDGGHILQDTLFCRNRWLDGIFRIAAIIGLVAIGFLLGAKILPYLAIPMALALPIAFKLGKVTDQMRQLGLPEPISTEDRVPPATAQAIIKAVKGAFSEKLNLSNKALAQHTLTIFERLNARPPSALATTCLVLLQGGAFVTAAVVGILLIVGGDGGLRRFALAASRQPQHHLEVGDVESRNSSSPSVALPRNLIVATLKNREAAKVAYSDIVKSHPEAPIQRVGDSIFVQVPVSDDAAREKWFDALQHYSTNTFVAISNAPVSAFVSCIAPDKQAGTNLTRQLGNYLVTASQMHLIAPWSPEAQKTDFATYLRTREQWASIQEQMEQLTVSSFSEAHYEKIDAAIRRGAMAEAQRLQKEQSKKEEEVQAQAKEGLMHQSGSKFDGSLVQLYAKMYLSGLTNIVERKSLLRELAGKLGEVPYTGSHPAVGADRYGVTSGYASQQGLLLQLSMISFYEPADGLPALAQWLSKFGCRQIRYDLYGPRSLNFNDYEEEEPE
jgi:Zn-dependent protease